MIININNHHAACAFHGHRSKGAQIRAEGAKTLKPEVGYALGFLSRSEFGLGEEGLGP